VDPGGWLDQFDAELYFSSEMGTGSGSMIALVAAIVFATVGVGKTVRAAVLKPKRNLNSGDSIYGPLLMWLMIYQFANRSNDA
jgi:hypothetical protein